MATETTAPPPPPTQQAATLAKIPRSVKDLLMGPEFEAAVKACLPKHLTSERFVRMALTCLMRQPELTECSKESLFLAMLQLSSLGIEADGRRAHLIPFNNNKVCICHHPVDQHKGLKCMVHGCQCNARQSRRDVNLIVDYKGLAELVRRSGDVSYMHCDAVYQEDEWDFTYGSGAFLKHKPNLKVEDRGRIIAFYSFVKLRDGNEDFIIMPKSEVDKIRKRSKAADSGPWVTDYEQMGAKTIFRRHSKWLPLSPEVKDAVETDDEPIDMGGALQLSGSLVVSEPEQSRLDRQMAEQAEDETPPVVVAASSAQSESKVMDAPAPGPVAVENKPKGIGPPWDNKKNMLTAFEMMRAQLEDASDMKSYGRIVSANSLDFEEMSVNSKEMAIAFGELEQAVRDADKGEGDPVNDEPVAPTIQFTRPPKRG